MPIRSLDISRPVSPIQDNSPPMSMSRLGPVARTRWLVPSEFTALMSQGRSVAPGLVVIKAMVPSLESQDGSNCSPGPNATARASRLTVGAALTTGMGVASATVVSGVDGSAGAAVG